ncbi:Os08g0191650 [Oryza sativa Japonica Group]|jgi:hypothetical protein|uniref:Os08g0191650 protein n=1 Tax=Oryza sativa subsp. japonica TaxID=39947 RepID=A0A0P0XCI6_ORYSJ|nr:hypothetical protein EE612_042568 [Oryza sativa]BAT04177.1 Os08g0191650 [Oryza sativa Japonica Group]
MCQNLFLFIERKPLLYYIALALLHKVCALPPSTELGPSLIFTGVPSGSRRYQPKPKVKNIISHNVLFHNEYASSTYHWIIWHISKQLNATAFEKLCSKKI